MAARFRNTGRKSSRFLCGAAAGTWRGSRAGITIAATSTAAQAVAAPSRKAASGPAIRSITPAIANDAAPEMPTPAGMPGNRTGLRDAFQRIGDCFKARHISAGPADASEDTQHKPRPKSVRNKREAEMRECGKTSTEHVDPARRDPVRQGDEDGHHPHMCG